MILRFQPIPAIFIEASFLFFFTLFPGLSFSRTAFALGRQTVVFGVLEGWCSLPNLPFGLFYELLKLFFGANIVVQ